jgi:hypothetical protein
MRLALQNRFIRPPEAGSRPAQLRRADTNA